MLFHDLPTLDQESQLRLEFEYGKPHLHFVASGTAALEVSLRALGVQDKDYVLVPSHTCYLVGASVLRIGARVKFVDVGDRLVIGPDSVTPELLSMSRAIVAVHSYGLPCDIKALRSRVGSEYPILEDASLAYNLRYKGHSVGTDSDIVVSSLGPKKPLSLGEGGLIASGAFVEKVTKLLERGGNARYENVPPMPYELSPWALTRMPESIRIADETVKKRRTLHAFVQQELTTLPYELWELSEGDLPVWNRLPLWARDETTRSVALEVAEGLNVLQPPFEIPVECLPMFNNGRFANHSIRNKEHLLLFLRMDSFEAICQWIERLHRILD